MNATFDPKQARGLANLILLSSFLALVSAAAFRESPVGRWIFVAVEAIFVASFADWFAVTALFRKPLGFGWHTDIIRTQHDAIGSGLGTFIESRLLTRESLVQKINELSPSKQILEFAARNSELELADRLVEGILGSVRTPDPELVDKIHGFLLSLASQARISPYLANLLEDALKGGRGSASLRFIGLWLAQMVRTQDVRRFLRKEIEDSYEGLGFFKKKLVDKDDLGRAGMQLLDHLAQDLESGNGMTEALESRLRKLVVELRRPTSKVARELEELKEAILAKADLRNEIRAALCAMAEPRSAAALKEIVALVLRRSLATLADSPFADSADQQIRQMLISNLDALYRIMARLMDHVFSELITQDELVDYIDTTIGDSLHGIRVTGAIVGLLVGLAVGGLTMVLHG